MDRIELSSAQKARFGPIVAYIAQSYSILVAFLSILFIVVFDK